MPWKIKNRSLTNSLKVTRKDYLTKKCMIPTCACSVSIALRTLGILENKGWQMDMWWLKCVGRGETLSGPPPHEELKLPH